MDAEEASTASSPLLRPEATRSPPPHPPSSARPRRLSALLGRAAGRRDPSMLVREAAALHLEERRADWAHSRLVVTLDVAWNLAFAAAAAAVLSATIRERPNTPVRVWVVGYALQCVLHVLLVCVEYRRRQQRRQGSGRRGVEEGGGGAGVGAEGAARDSDSVVSEDVADDGVDRSGRRFCNVKRCESVNTMASFLWWFLGFYWVVSGGDTLLQNAPTLYWLTVVFLSFDVFFAIFCIALACVIGIALCCCLPCIIAILYAVVGQEGASDADISILPRFRYTGSSESGEKSVEEGLMIPILNNDGISTCERVLPREDAECCICLTSYEEGSNLHALPCNHHFHSSCIVKWLRINATCPLCKYNILKGNDV